MSLPSARVQTALSGSAGSAGLHRLAWPLGSAEPDPEMSSQGTSFNQKENYAARDIPVSISGRRVQTAFGGSEGSQGMSIGVRTPVRGLLNVEPGENCRGSALPAAFVAVVSLSLVGCGDSETTPVSDTDPGVAESVAPPEESSPPIDSEAVEKWIRLRSASIARLENLEYSAAVDGFDELAAALPYESLPATNLVIASLLQLEDAASAANRRADSEKYRAAMSKATASVDRLRERAPEDALTEYFAGILASLVGDTNAASDRFRRASRLDPANPVIWFRLYATLSSGQPGNAEADAALNRAQELQPWNLYLMPDHLLAQVTAQDPDTMKSFDAAETILKPLISSVQRSRRISGVDLLQDARAAVAEDNWKLALNKIRILRNITRPEIASQIDQRRVDRSLLEFVIYDFSDQFHQRAAAAGYSRPSPEPIEIAFRRGSDVAATPVTSVVDFDLDGRLDVVTADHDRIVVYTEADGGRWRQSMTSDSLPGVISGFITADLDRDYVTNFASPRLNADGVTVSRDESGEPAPVRVVQIDADMDMIAWGEFGLQVFRNVLDDTGARSLEIIEQTEDFKALDDIASVTAIDLEHDGDLDLVVATREDVSLWSNSGEFRFEMRGQDIGLPKFAGGLHTGVPVDWNRDVATDLVMVGNHTGQNGRLENLLHGRFRWVQFPADFECPAAINAAVVADVDSNGSWDLVCGSDTEIVVSLTTTGESGNPQVEHIQRIESSADGLICEDFDNDGLSDLAAWSHQGVRFWRGTPDAGFVAAEEWLVESPGAVVKCDFGDVDMDGDIDLLIVDAQSAAWWLNEGGNANQWIDVVLRAETADAEQFPSMRINMHGIASVVEVRAGDVYQVRVVHRPVTHFGLGSETRADVVRVIWTNGVPQNAIHPRSGQPIMAQQDLKGSCPFLYTWTGHRFEFLTDLCWAAPLGLQASEQELVACRSWENILIPGDCLIAHEGEYRLQVTEELWESAYFDHIQLIAVDHPDDTDVYSNEKVGPASIAEYQLHTVREPRAVRSAVDASRRNVESQIRERDDVYVRPYRFRHMQGLTDEHYLELETGLSEQPQQITLFLTGWLIPTDTSLNIAISQHAGFDPPQPLSIQVPNEHGEWVTTIPFTGFPGGKTKTVAIDISDAFLTNDFRLRLVSGMELAWDHIFFTTEEQPVEIREHSLSLLSSNLHYRGFSRRVPSDSNGPETFLYDDCDPAPRWPPMRGLFTSYGSVAGLIAAADDDLVVMSSGDELTLTFRADDGPPAGWKRDFILHTTGWDKDADLNTVYGQSAGPLPFRDMSSYPFSTGEEYPDAGAATDDQRTTRLRSVSRNRFWKFIRNPGNGSFSHSRDAWFGE